MAIAMMCASHRAYHAAITREINGLANLGRLAGLCTFNVLVWLRVAWGELVPRRGQGLLVDPRALRRPRELQHRAP